MDEEDKNNNTSRPTATPNLNQISPIMLQMFYVTLIGTVLYCTRFFTFNLKCFLLFCYNWMLVFAFFKVVFTVLITTLGEHHITTIVCVCVCDFCAHNAFNHKSFSRLFSFCNFTFVPMADSHIFVFVFDVIMWCIHIAFFFLFHKHKSS